MANISASSAAVSNNLSTSRNFGRVSTHNFVGPVADWNILKRRCTREPPCELWDEDMLLEENEREMEDVQANAGGMRPHEGHNHVPFVEQTQVHRVRDMNWLNNPGVLCHVPSQSNFDLFRYV